MSEVECSSPRRVLLLQNHSFEQSGSVRRGRGSGGCSSSANHDWRGLSRNSWNKSKVACSLWAAISPTRHRMRTMSYPCMNHTSVFRVSLRSLAIRVNWPSVWPGCCRKLWNESHLKTRIVLGSCDPSTVLIAQKHLVSYGFSNLHGKLHADSQQRERVAIADVS